MVAHDKGRAPSNTFPHGSPSSPHSRRAPPPHGMDVHARATGGECADCAGHKKQQERLWSTPTAPALLRAHKSSTVAQQTATQTAQESGVLFHRREGELGLGLLMDIWMLVMLIWILGGGKFPIPHFAVEVTAAAKGRCRRALLEQTHLLLPQRHVCHTGSIESSCSAPWWGRKAISLLR